MSLTLASVISRNESNFLANPVGEEIIILNMETGDYLGLNTVGASIWEHLQESGTVQKIVDKLMAEYEIDSETCTTETISYLEKINKLGLLRIDS
jgi:hypothetical protein